MDFFVLKVVKFVVSAIGAELPCFHRIAVKWSTAAFSSGIALVNSKRLENSFDFNVM